MELGHVLHLECLGVSGLCNLYLKQFSFINIKTLLNDCSHIEDVHLLFRAHLIIFLGSLNLDIIMYTLPLGCLIHLVICNSNSLHPFLFKPCILISDILKMCTFYFVQF